MSLKTAKNALPIYACIDDSTYQVAVCEAAGRLAQEIGLPIHLFHVIDIHDKDHSKKHSDNPAEVGQESIVQKLLNLEAGLATVEDEDKATLLDSLHRKMNAEYLVKVDYEQIEGDFEENLIAQQSNMDWLVIGKSGKTNEGSPDTIGNHTLSILKQMSLPTLVVNTPYHLMSDILIAVTGTQPDIDWLQRLIAAPYASHWLKEKNVHLVMVNPDRMHPNHQKSPVIVTDSEINQTAPEEHTSTEPLIVSGVEITTTVENDNAIEDTIESALDKIKSLAKEVTQTLQETFSEAKADTKTPDPHDLNATQNNSPTLAWDLVSFQQATSDWDDTTASLHRQVVFQSDLVKVMLGYVRDNRINAIILPTIPVEKSQVGDPRAADTSNMLQIPQRLPSQALPTTTTPELVEALLKASDANLILLP